MGTGTAGGEQVRERSDPVPNYLGTKMGTTRLCSLKSGTTTVAVKGSRCFVPAKWEQSHRVPLHPFWRFHLWKRPPTLQCILASVCCHSNWKQWSFAANFGSGIGSNAGLSFDNWRQQWQRLWQQTESCCQKWQQEWQRFGSTNLAAAKRGGSFHIPSARTR